MKVEAYSSERVTEQNKNGKCILDLDDPDDIKTFGGQDAVDEYMRNQKISEEIVKMAEERLAIN